jgi:8-oxo-dGTP pyrophosphatase MutT (NUDIX family)
MKLRDETVRTRLELPLGDWRTQDGLRDSAVVAIVVERDGVDHVVFNRRRDDLPHHAGEVSFPGGTREGDEDAVACALRETCEEMGLRNDDLSVLGRLPERISIAGFKVVPFAARLVTPRPYTPAVDEVAEVFEIPCGAFMQAERWGYRETRHPLARFRRVPFFDYESRRVWGLTGIILRDFVTQVMGFAPPA